MRLQLLTKKHKCIYLFNHKWYRKQLTSPLDVLMELCKQTAVTTGAVCLHKAEAKLVIYVHVWNTSLILNN